MTLEEEDGKGESQNSVRSAKLPVLSCPNDIGYPNIFTTSPEVETNRNKN